jgi:uncharacterized SAM-dependent methyltransferase
MAKNAAQQIVPDDELDELIDGLKQPEKMISPKYFYDERGSQLFEEITRLPEYYPTETELGIMRDNVGEIAELVGKQASLIEFGSGSSLKTRVLLENLDELAAYVPVDISEDHLLESAQQIREDFPDLDVLPVVADFTQPFQLPSPKIMPVRNIVYFPGSTIGNFTHDAAHELLQVMHEEAGAGGALLIGVDLQWTRLRTAPNTTKKKDASRYASSASRTRNSRSAASRFRSPGTRPFSPSIPTSTPSKASPRWPRPPGSGWSAFGWTPNACSACSTW